MDVISKLLGQDVNSPKVPSVIQDKDSKKMGLLKGGQANKYSAAAGHIVDKTSVFHTAHRTRKSLGKHDTDYHEHSSAGKSEHPKFIEESNFKSSIMPGKREGTYSLPFDASITVPEDCFGKKDTLVCRVATPQTRWQNCPCNMAPNELINSEIYTLTSSAHLLKANVIFCIPFHPINFEFNEINVKVKWTGHVEWVNVGHIVKELDNKPYVELDINKLGTFVVTAKPKTETFEVTTQGCLYQARLSRHITIRFPRKAVPQDMRCTLQIIPISAKKLQLTKEQYLTDSAHIVVVTEFIDVITSERCRFARPVTVKLPLPASTDMADGGGGKRQQDLVVLRKTSAGWELVESSYRFSRTTVCFDVKELSRFCVVQCVPGRQKKMPEAITLLEERSEKEKGEICLFLSVQNKSWLALVEVIPKHLSLAKISARKRQGFTVVRRSPSRAPGAGQFRLHSRRLQAMAKNATAEPIDDSFELFEGLTWSIYVDGDVKICATSDIRENTQLRYFARLSESFRTFYFEPPDMDPRPLEASVNLAPLALNDESLRGKMTFTFKIQIEESAMVEYLVPDSPRETGTLLQKMLQKPKEPELPPVPESPKEEIKPQLPPAPKLKEQPPVKITKRIITFKKPVIIQAHPHIPIFERPLPNVFSAERESKALSGRSLMALAKLVPEGLSLAVHLQLPDSTITGIGFDALSNNLNMSDVSYKILLHWKRKCKDKQMGAVSQLIEALREMNYHVVAEALLRCHLQHKEFTRDCIAFMQDEDTAQTQIA